MRCGVLEAVGWLGVLACQAPGAQQARFFPGSRRLPASRSVFLLWRGDLSLYGGFPAHRAVNAPCCENSPRRRRSALRAARTLRGNAGQHSVLRELSPVATENARGHAADDGERSAIMLRRGNTRRSPARRSRAAGTGPGPLRKNRTEPRGGRALAGQADTRRAPREATCLIPSHAAVSRTAAMLRDHVRDRDHGRSPRSGQRRCSVIMPANVITDDSSCQERLPGDPGS